MAVVSTLKRPAASPKQSPKRSPAKGAKTEPLSPGPAPIATPSTPAPKATAAKAAAEKHPPIPKDAQQVEDFGKGWQGWSAKGLQPVQDSWREEGFLLWQVLAWPRGLWEDCPEKGHTGECCHWGQHRWLVRCWAGGQVQRHRTRSWKFQGACESLSEGFARERLWRWKPGCFGSQAVPLPDHQNKDPNPQEKGSGTPGAGWWSQHRGLHRHESCNESQHRAKDDWQLQL